MAPNMKALIYLGLLTVFSGISFLLLVVAADGIPPITAVTIFMLLGSLLTFPLIRLQGYTLPPAGRIWLQFVLLGVANMLLPLVLIAVAQERISSGLTAVLFSTSPIFTAVLAVLWASEAFDKTRFIGLFIGLGGTVVLLLPGLLDGIQADLISSLLVLLASFLRAFAAVFTDKVFSDIEPLVIVFGMLLMTAVVALPLSFILEAPAQVNLLEANFLGILAFTAFVVVGFFLLLFALIKLRGPTYASLVRFTGPPFALLVGSVFAAETFHWTTLIGLVIILICIAIMNGYFARLPTFRQRPQA